MTVTLRERIRQLAVEDPKRTTRQISDLLGLKKTTYVRVTLRQRVDGATSRFDRRYIADFVAQHGCVPSTVRYRANPEFRSEMRLRNKLWKQQHKGSPA